MAKQVMPLARLEARPTDIKVPDDLLLKISLFAQLKRKPTLDKFPGTLVLRCYRKGDVICRQGEAGWTAFYILTAKDAHELCQTLGQTATSAVERQLCQTLERQQARRLEELKANPGDRAHLQVAKALLTVARPEPVEEPGLLQRSLRRWSGAPAPTQAPVSIPIDAPTDIDYDTMQAPLHEGEMFGENSCRYGIPRSVTVVATRNCFMLEMLRNILEQIQKDAAYKARTDAAYKQRVLDFDGRKLSILADLSDAQFQAIRSQVDLVTFEPGQVIYDEHEPSDGIYLIHRGMVKVLKKASVLLTDEHIRNWQALGARLKAGESETKTPCQRLWQLLPEPARVVCSKAAETGRTTDAEQHVLLDALNRLLRDPAVGQSPEFAPLTATEAFEEMTEDIPNKPAERSDQDWRRWNRLLLDAACDGQVRPYRRRVGPDCVLDYCSRGDFFGEGSVLGQRYRGETCLAHGHPEDAKSASDAGPLELVRIPSAVLADLLDEVPAVRTRLERKAAERRKKTQEQVRVPVWDESRQVVFSKKFQELGLIEGQKLMLIDLDRCTRCDECVQACANTHADGHSRLFLDGHRFGKYLVPISCRSCLDPVCMIGCPVGSIHRGDNGQMVIEDWCIGCGLCAQQCPYGSILMHDIGVIAEDARGWRFSPRSTAGSEDWVQLRFRARRWLEGTGPFVNDRAFRDALTPYLPAAPPAPSVRSLPSMLDISIRDVPDPVLTPPARVGQPLCFRYEFRLARKPAIKERQFRLTISSGDPELAVWINGFQAQPDEKDSRGKRGIWFPPKPQSKDRKTVQPTVPGRPTQMSYRDEEAVARSAARVAALSATLRGGRNVLAIQVSPDHDAGSVFLRVRLDEVRKPKIVSEAAEEVTVKQVTERAVVCDLCSSQWGQVPACVNACPHDAAMRIDARSEFPIE